MNQADKPLVDALRTFAGKKPVSFHVPGHKNGLLDATGFLRSLGPTDATEVTGLDDLHAPEEAILEAERLLAAHYRTKYSFLLVNGTTGGNLAMVLAACKRGDTVFAARNSHKSIVHACALAGVRVIWLEPEVDEKTETPVGVSCDVLEEAIRLYPESKALILTYPSYYGHTYEIGKLIELAQGHGLTVLVDEAHGAHFSLPGFPESSLAFGADVVVQSAHKTLPAMTMGSYLHVGTDRVPVSRLRRFLGMVQSSSPSYPIMASLDGARSYLATMDEKEVAFFFDWRNRLIVRIEEIGLHVKQVEDPLKLVIAGNCSGFALQEALESEGIYTELADPSQVLLVLPLLKEELFPTEEVLSGMERAIRNLQKEHLPSHAERAAVNPVMVPVLSFDEVEESEKGWIPVDKAAGRIAAGAVIPYPPGIPYLLPGERITQVQVEQLRRWKTNPVHFQGEQRVSEGLVYVIK